MLIKMTRWKTLELCDNLASYFSDIRDTKFAYVLQKNIKLAKPIETELMKIAAPSEAFKKFENERIALCKHFAQKDAELNPISKDGHFVFGDNKAAFDKEYAKLKFANGSIIAEQEKKRKIVDGLLDEEVETDFLGIKESSLPINLSVQQLEILDPIIIAEV